MAPSLASLQAWFQQQLLGAGDAPAWSIAELITPSRHCTPEARLAVYQHAYVARLLECLRAEFPAVCHALGKDVFENMAVAHVHRHPPQSYTLAALGAEFPETLTALRPARSSPAPDLADFVIQLAVYERAVQEAFDAPGPEATHEKGQPQFEGLWQRTRPHEALEGCRLEFYPCVRPLRADFPVHDYASLVRAGTPPAACPPARPVWLILHRRHYRVRRWEVPAWQFALVSALQLGQTLGGALTQCGVLESVPDPENVVFETFAEWSRLDMIQRVVHPADL